MPSTRGACGSCLETERKFAGVKKKASRDLGSALVSNGKEKRPSMEMCMMRMRHDEMSGCAGNPKQNGETAANLLQASL